MHIPGDISTGVLNTTSPADGLMAETQPEQHASDAASPSRRILQGEESTLSVQLAKVMDMSSSPQSEKIEKQQQHDVGIVISPRRCFLRKTSSSCVPASADSSAPPVLISGGEVWRRFTPSVINPFLCLARTYNAGAGGQCKRKPKLGEDICGACNKNLAHGRVDGPIPEVKLAVFLRAAGGR